MRDARRGRGEAVRRYPPLAVIVASLLLALFALPSALNVPLANPGQTLEYAPVPGSNGQTPPGGNIAGLALGSGDAGPGGGGSGGAGLGGAPLGPLTGSSANPRAKQCVGNPPRQTEDPLSPPCVAFFQGDNGGATYTGVTAHEVRIVFYMNSGTYYGGPDNSVGYTVPADTYVDIDNLGDPNASHVLVRILRGWEHYFNLRYQTYNRAVHFFAFFADSSNSTPEKRRADASANFLALHPFAVISTIFEAASNQDVYLQAMAQKGVLDFGSYFPRSASFFSANPGLIWSYPPSVEQLGDMYASYICTKVVPFAVSFSGNPGDTGPRRLGILHSTDPSRPDLAALYSYVLPRIKQCGGNVVADDTFSSTGQTAVNTEAATNIADFVRKGVTTVIWPGGLEGSHSHAAAAANYRPEWVVAGDGQTDGNGQTAVAQEPSVWAHAWVVSAAPFVPDYNQAPCYLAYRQVDDQASQSEVQSWGCRLFYDAIRQLFTGIQVAGPHLDPASIDQGFHAIPRVQLNSPLVPTCYYLSGDYSCVKDAIAEWWDPSGTPPGQSVSGCYRVTEGGRRYLAGGWRDDDVRAEQRSSDQCNSYSGIT